MIALRAGSATDIGRVRNSNQDVALVDPELFAVADGMGGHVGGEVAARVAVATLRAAFERQPTVDGLRRAVAEANRAVWRQSQADTSLRGMGTTLTATALVRAPDGSPVVALANVGDSRAYVYSDGQVVQVTDDHSLAEEKVRQGELTEEEAAVHPHRHILTRALGVASDVDVDLWELRLQGGDRILLCSDGLTNEVADERIGSILAEAKDPDVAAHELVRVALDSGGNDNITVVVVDVVGDATGPVSPPAAAVPAAGPPTVASASAGSGEPMTAVIGVPPPVAPAPPAGPDAMATAGVGVVTAAVPAAAATAVGAAGAPTGVVRPTPTQDPPGRPPGRAPRGGGAQGSRRVGGLGAPPADAGRLVSTSGGTSRSGEEEPVSRRQRRRARRRAGIPRLVTVRVLVFLILLGGIVYGAYYLVRWYANDDWYVTVQNTHLAVYHGRPGGFLWYKPKLAVESTVTTAEIPTFYVPTVKRYVEEPTLKAAQSYIVNLHQQFLATQQSSTGVTPNATTTTAAGGTTTTKPKATTTTKPKATTTTKPVATTTARP